MFIDEQFPDDISYNSTGSTRFQTDVVIVDSGFDQRTSRWDQPSWSMTSPMASAPWSSSTT
jgi:hypothetical protein